MCPGKGSLNRKISFGHKEASGQKVVFEGSARSRGLKLKAVLILTDALTHSVGIHASSCCIQLVSAFFKNWMCQPLLMTSQQFPTCDLPRIHTIMLGLQAMQAMGSLHILVDFQSDRTR